MDHRSYTYQAFISYRHIKPDMDIAKELHRQIESYSIPSTLKKRLGIKKMGKVFRDQEELPTSADLGMDIQHALEESNWLIVICTPRLPASKWCMKEIDAFIAMGKEDHILTLLVEGEPEESFPPQLRFRTIDGVKVEVEPLAADVRSTDPKEMLKKLKVEKLRILAPILGVSFDDLKQRAKEQRLRNIAKISAATSLLLAAFGLYAINRNAIIAKERDNSYRNEMLLLLEKSTLATRQGDKIAASIHALDALEISSKIQHDQEETLQNALESSMYANLGDEISYIKNNNMILTDLTFSPTGDRLLAIANTNSAVLIDPYDGEMLFTVNNNLEPLGSVGFSKDGQQFFTICHWENSLTIWDSNNGEKLWEYKMEDRESWVLGFASFTSTPDQMVIKEEDRLLLWNTATNQEEVLMEDLQSFATRYASVTVSDDGKILGLLGDLDGKIHIWDLENKGTWTLDDKDDRYEEMLAFNADGSLLASSSGPTVEIWNMNSRQIFFSYEMTSGDVTDMSFSPSQNLLALSSTLSVDLLDLEEEEINQKIDSEMLENQICRSTFSPDGSYLLIHQWGFRLYDVETGVLLTDFYDLKGSDAIFHRNGSLLLSTENGHVGAFATPDNATVTTMPDYDEPLFFTPRFTPPDDKEIQLETNHVSDPTFGSAPPQMYSSPDGIFLALAHSDGFVEIWKIGSSNRALYGIAEHTLPVTDMIFHEGLMASASKDGRVMLFDLELGQIRSVIPATGAVDRLEFSPDGRKIMIFCSQQQEALVFDTQQAIHLFTLKSKDPMINDMGFDRNNTQAVLINGDGSAEIGKLFSQQDLLLDAINNRIHKTRKEY
ncbi:toll/interleukin-1 receptor domain-containing protein [Alkalibacter rhizosphaerae]|uniref:Toll/interleukin-1 receptor domain-containing protein n=1 Tax=Alkalibacter rhizosphaerae TaxID=2815577 RepID=A0A974XEX4_9FIRM|nr:toll/interleukin-1 receptor domain-containing protein [Alkalibacter rhizosphaerae]QSX08563.1 toll/interleukin-1 receptor domain-containing protein [Alkalibacter rhizosphaerae]